jgi:hypothetical protein
MKVIRHEVFETNSSSMHSLSISAARDYTYPSGKTYVIIAEEYGWSGPTLREPEEKLSYLMALVASSTGINWAIEEKGVKFSIKEFLRLPEIKKIVNAVKDHGSDIIYKKSSSGFGSVDHQSVCNLDSFLNGIDLEEFIFNSKYEIVITNDNI